MLTKLTLRKCCSICRWTWPGY